MFKIYVMNLNRQMRGVFKMCDVPGWLSDGARLIYMMNRDVFTKHDEPESLHEGPV